MSEDDKNKEEGAEVIDFTVVKLQQMIDNYEDLGLHEQADDVDGALEQYLAGELLIRWQDGMPFVVLDVAGELKKPGGEDA
jgi:hypothetical protein|tara:strand:+ start:1290 stop:1532 length:243 start_codon:yes stop_codon:yes gene_type:complete